MKHLSGCSAIEELNFVRQNLAEALANNLDGTINSILRLLLKYLCGSYFFCFWKDIFHYPWLLSTGRTTRIFKSSLHRRLTLHSSRDSFFFRRFRVKDSVIIINLCILLTCWHIALRPYQVSFLFLWDLSTETSSPSRYHWGGQLSRYRRERGYALLCHLFSSSYYCLYKSQIVEKYSVWCCSLSRHHFDDKNLKYTWRF